ncbi:hypothetical protein ACVGX7_00185, partial [Enterobacter hormaechei]
IKTPPESDNHADNSTKKALFILTSLYTYEGVMAVYYTHLRAHETYACMSNGEFCLKTGVSSGVVAVVLSGAL